MNGLEGSNLEKKIKGHQKAKMTLQIAEKMQVRATPVDYASLSKIRLNLSGLFQKKYQQERTKTKNHPKYKKKKNLESKYDSVNQALPQLKKQAESTYQKKKKDDHIKGIELKIEKAQEEVGSLKSKLNQDTKELDKLERELNTVQNQMRNASSEVVFNDLRVKEKKILNKYKSKSKLYNDNVKKVNSIINQSNQDNKDLQAALDLAYLESFANYNKTIKQLNNNIIPELNLLNKDIITIEKPWKDALFYRDVEWANARNQLLHSSNTNSEDLTSAEQFNSSKTPYTNLYSDKSLYTDTPWCASIDYHCERCFGLAVLSCEFSQMDARSACQKGQPFNARLNNHGTGGMIGSCGKLILINDDEFMGHQDPSQPYSQYGTYKDWKENQEARKKLKEMAKKIFDQNQTTNPDEFLSYLIKTLENSNSEEAKEMAAVLEHLKKSKELYDHEEFGALIDKLRNAENDEEKNEIAKELATVAVNIGAHHTEMTSIDNFTLTDAEKLSNMIKYGSIFLDDYKNPTNPLDNAGPMTNLLSATHGVLALAEGSQTGNAEMMMDGLRDTIGVLPGASSNPITAIIDIPGEVAASMINVTRKGWDQSSNALQEVNNAISGDPDALNRLENISKDIEKTLSPRNYGESMLNALKNRVIDKVPFARTLVNWWNS
jgi:hypothetical protein